MSLTIFLAQVIGIYFLMAGASAMFYPQRLGRATREMAKSYIMPYFDGALALIVGLLIVLTHNVWVDLTSSVVTAVGWLAVAEGAVMFLLPQSTIAKFIECMSSKRAGTIFAIITIVVGAYLVYSGFFA